jgi:hypothetical protein
MRVRTTIASRAIATGVLVLVSFTGAIALTDAAWAKHKKSPVSSNSDPCAAPTGFIKDHIKKIQALQASLKTPKSTVAGMFGSSSHDDPDTLAKISDLRHDADGVNDLLRSGGCTPIDIDKELKAAYAPPPAPLTQGKHKHY